MSGSSFVLRTLYIDPQLDERLKHEAYVSNISKNELIRKYLEVGIATVDGKMGTKVYEISPKVEGIDPRSVSPAKSVATKSTVGLRALKKKTLSRFAHVTSTDSRSVFPGTGMVVNGATASKKVTKKAVPARKTAKKTGAKKVAAKKVATKKTTKK